MLRGCGSSIAAAIMDFVFSVIFSLFLFYLDKLLRNTSSSLRPARHFLRASGRAGRAPICSALADHLRALLRIRLTL
jgi:hypothetical protein